MGLTDLAKQVAGPDSALSQTHFDAERLRDLILEHQPHLLAFTGKRAAQEFVQRPVDYGLLCDSIGATRLFVLPSPSGAARRFWDEAPWRELSRLRGHRRRGGQAGWTRIAVGE
jgi:TDG/mug DNA glycosylase family protein